MEVELSVVFELNMLYHDTTFSWQYKNRQLFFLHPCIDNPLSPLIGEMIGIAFICLEKFIWQYSKNA